ncbi:Hypothetical protein FKW44_016043 [Caligus rogercresseyi]|uniref:Uncharacterized protein n=1 Tax=Caligus rogercresseyi TaxID=217165 RepID=A0A7T8H152_CALRO|nr:Hypothetical protein FKW44_016043 [Caligus rogercresseyi]
MAKSATRSDYGWRRYCPPLRGLKKKVWPRGLLSPFQDGGVKWISKNAKFPTASEQR